MTEDLITRLRREIAALQAEVEHLRTVNTVAEDLIRKNVAYIDELTRELEATRQLLRAREWVQ